MCLSVPCTYIWRSQPKQNHFEVSSGIENVLEETNLKFTKLSLNKQLEPLISACKLNEIASKVLPYPKSDALQAG